MSQAEIISITSRRNALRFGLGATVAGLVTPAIAAPNGDAALLDLCHELDAGTGRLQRHDLAAAARRETIGEDELYDLLDEWNASIERIISVPARTTGGIRAKAGALGNALMLRVCVNTGEGFEEQAEDYERLAMSLVRDLMAAPA